MTETEIKLFQPPNEFYNYLRDSEHGRYLWAAISLWNNFELISSKLSRSDIKLVQADVDKGWHNFEIILFHM